MLQLTIDDHYVKLNSEIKTEDQIKIIEKVREKEWTIYHPYLGDRISHIQSDCSVSHLLLSGATFGIHN